MNDGANQTNATKALESHAKLLELIDELRQVEAPYEKQLPQRDEESWNKFFAWIDEELQTPSQDKNKPSGLSSKVGIKKLGGESNQKDDECSLVSKVAFKKGDELFRIHRRLMLSTETAAKDIDLHDFIKKDTIASSMQNVVLVLHLLNEYSKENRSKWQSYLSILPRKMLPVLTMTKDKLELLKSSAHIFEALKMIRAIARQYAYFYKRLELTNLPLRRDFSFQYYIWGVSIVCSRQNEIPPMDRTTRSSQVAGGLAPVHALIPILDMCNHDLNSNQAQFESSETHLLAHKDLEVNQEITLNYGSRSSGEFYIHNGFVPQEVPNDMLPLTVVLNDKDPLFGTKVKLLKTFNMLQFGRFRLMQNTYENRHKRDPHLTMFLIVHLLNEDELDYIEESKNPVGVADEIYEYVQYNKYAAVAAAASAEQKHQPLAKQETEMQDKEENQINDNDDQLTAMKKRLEQAVQEYLSKRALIGVALLDHVLEKQKCHIDIHTSRLLKHEQSIFRSYIIKPDT